MARPLRNNGTTLSLRRARARLDAWQARVTAIRELCDGLLGEAHAGIRPILLELIRRYDQAARQAQRLQEIEASWDDARAEVDRRVRELEQGWDAIVEAIRPPGRGSAPDGAPAGDPAGAAAGDPAGAAAGDPAGAPASDPAGAPVSDPAAVERGRRDRHAP